MKLSSIVLAGVIAAAFGFGAAFAQPAPQPRAGYAAGNPPAAGAGHRARHMPAWRARLVASCRSKATSRGLRQPRMKQFVQACVRRDVAVSRHKPQGRRPAASLPVG